MSRTLILTLAAAATITVASFASSETYARGGGGGHSGGHASRSVNHSVGTSSRGSGTRLGSTGTSGTKYSPVSGNNFGNSGAGTRLGSAGSTAAASASASHRQW